MLHEERKASLFMNQLMLGGSGCVVQLNSIPKYKEIQRSVTQQKAQEQGTRDFESRVVRRARRRWPFEGSSRDNLDPSNIKPNNHTASPISAITFDFTLYSQQTIRSHHESRVASLPQATSSVHSPSPYSSYLVPQTRY